MKLWLLLLALLMLGVSGVYAGYGMQNSVLSPQSSVSGPQYSAIDSLSQFEILHSFLTTYPSRSLESILITVPGIAEIDGDLHVRGSRKHQTGYLLNGFSVLDRYSTTLGIPYIPEALEQVTAHTGAYDASLGMNGGGIVEMRIREGGERFQATAKYLTDDVVKPGESFLGNTYSYGWNTAVATVEGPLPFNTNFFVAGEVHRARDREPMYLEPMYYEFVQDNVGGYAAGTPLPHPFVITRNHVPAHTLEHSALQWNISGDLLGVHASFIGSIGREEKPLLNWYDIVQNYYRQNRILRDVSDNSFAGMSLTTSIGSDISVRAMFGRYAATEHAEDPDMGEQYLLYADSAANAAFGYTGFISRYLSPQPYSVVYGFDLHPPNRPNGVWGTGSYYTRSRSSTQAKIESDIRLGETTSLSTGIEAEWWTVRSFSITNGQGYAATYNDYYPYASPTPEYKLRTLRTYTSTVGYDAYGNESEERFWRSRTPFFGAVYGTIMHTDGPVSFRMGMRQQFIGQDLLRLKGTGGDGAPSPFPVFDDNTYLVDESSLEFSPVIGYLLPRGEVVYHDDELTGRIGAAWFVDAYRMSALYVDPYKMSGRINPLFRVPYSLSPSPPLTYLARPERTSIIEATVQWTPFDGCSMSTAVYRKHLYDQIQQGTFVDAPGNGPLAGLINKGESTIYGWETSIEYSPVSVLTLAASYAYTEANGKAPDPSDWREVSESPDLYPDVMIPLPYAQKHRLQVGVCFEGPAESFLEGLRIRLFGRLLSGHPYTLEGPITFLGSSMPWRVGVRSLMDFRTMDPIETVNASVTPSTLTWDLHVAYGVSLWKAGLAVRVDVTNLFDTRNTLNVYPRSGSRTDDGWLGAPVAAAYKQIPFFTQLYDQLNNQNRWEYFGVTGNDMIAPPRQIRFGVEVEL